jgi:hypothetical protein
MLSHAFAIFIVYVVSKNSIYAIVWQGADHLTFEGGGGGILKKKFPARIYWTKKYLH